MINAFTNRRYPSTLQLQKLFDSSFDIICSIDISGRFLEVSEASMNVWGYRPEELIGLHYLDFVIEEDLQLTEEAVSKVMQGASKVSFENRYRHKDGKAVPVSWSAQWDAREKNMFCIARDTSEIKAKEILKANYEQEMLRKHSEMNEMLERITDGFFAVNKEWKFVYGNKQVEKILGIKVEEYLGKNLWACFPEAIGTVYEEYYQQAMRTKEPVQFRAYFPSFDRWFSVNAYPSQTGLSIFFRDTTESRRMEEDLKRSNERFRLAAKHTAIYDWDLISNTLEWGEGLYELFGYQSDEFQIDQWVEALHPDERNCLVEDIYKAINNPTVPYWKSEYQLYKKDGTICYVFERGYFVRDEKGEAIRMVGVMQDVTGLVRAAAEEKRYEKELARHNKHLTSILERMLQGFFSLDKELKVQYWNRSAEEILGVSRKDVLGKPIINFYKKEALAFYAPLFEQANRTQQAVHSEHICPQTDRWADVNIYPTEEGYSVFFKDIHEKKQTEEEVKLLSLIAKETVNGMMITRPDFTVIWVNDAFTRLSGYTSEEVVGENARKLLDGPETNQEVIKYILEKRQKGEPYRVEVVNYRKNGEKFWAEIFGQPMFDGAGKLQQFFAIATDITERKLAEAELKKLSLIAKRTNNIIIISSPQNHIVWANEAFTSTTGYQLEEVIGKHIGTVLDGPETDPFAIQYAREKFSKNEPFRLEVMNYKKDGSTYWADVTCHPVFDEEGKLLHSFSVATDVTERKQLQLVLDEEKRLRQQMITAAAIQAQERERAIVSQELHDNVNQVLTTVKLYTELCRDGIGNTRETMDKSIRLLQESIDEIRSLSKRLSAPSLGNIKLKDSIKELVDAIVGTNKITVVLQADEIEFLEVDQDTHLALYRILQEHFTNILKHAAAETVNVQVRLVGDDLCLQVTDDGKGFDTIEKRNGIGITNMITRAESLQGTLVINSKPGQGCQLIVRFSIGK